MGWGDLLPLGTFPFPSVSTLAEELSCVYRRRQLLVGSSSAGFHYAFCSPSVHPSAAIVLEQLELNSVAQPSLIAARYVIRMEAHVQQLRSMELSFTLWTLTTTYEPRNVTHTTRAR